MFGNTIPFELKFAIVELGMNKRTTVQDVITCLLSIVEYQARLIFAAELLTEWDIEPTAADEFRKEVKIAEDISHDVFGKLCATLRAKGIKSNAMETYFKEQLGSNIPFGPATL